MKLRIYLLVMAAAISAFGMRAINPDDPPIVPTASATTSSSSVQQEIPEEAIRLRILANSDDPRDQWLKRQVRDAVLQEMESWVNQPENIEEARRAVRNHLPRFQAVAAETVRRHGYDYPVKVDYGKVPFPTKLYGDRVYPAGEYEAVRIVIGDGEGDNWWCVLFPPLCFIDMESGDALPAQEQGRMTASASAAPSASPEPLEVRFFLQDTIEKVFSGWKD